MTRKQVLIGVAIIAATFSAAETVFLRHHLSYLLGLLCTFVIWLWNEYCRMKNKGE